MNEKFCIYCFRKDDLSKSHLFSECIGGSIYEFYSCTGCNSVIGSSIEGRLKEAPFFATALDVLNLQPRKQAYRNVRWEDAQTGDRLRLRDGHLEPTPQSKGDGQATGPPAFIREQFLGWVKKKRPHWLEFAKKALDDGQTRINIAGDIFEIRDNSGPRQVNMVSRTVFPWSVLAKITFEAMVAFGFPTAEVMQSYYRSTFTVYKRGEQTTRIDVADTFHRRIQCYQSHILQGKIDLKKLDYKPFHRIDLRVANSGVAYLKVNFFEVISFTVSLGAVNDAEFEHELLGQRLIFPLSEKQVLVDELQAKYADIRKMEDAVATARWSRFKANRDQ